MAELQSSEELIAKVRRMLWEEWDPIGVNEYSEASDEYDSYATEIAALIERHQSEKEIFDHLWRLETGHMGLEGDRDNTLRFSKRIAEMAAEYESDV